MQIAKLISFVFHPIVVPIASALLYFILIPNHMPREFSYRVLGLVFATTYILPMLLLYFLRKVKLIENYYLNTINERKLPVTFIIVLSFLIGNLFLKFDIINLLAYSFFAFSLSLIIVYLLFFFHLKTSLHTLAIAGQIGFIGLISYHYKNNLLLLLVVIIMLLGVIASARLKLKAHTLTEVMIGIIVGLLSQLTVYAYFTIYNM